jgi:hypothetical protein
MMDIRRTYQLTHSEFEALAGTQLYANLVSRKYVINLPSSSIVAKMDQEKMLNHLIDLHATGPWYCYADTYFFSNDDDACFFEKDMLEYNNDKDAEEDGYSNTKQRP